MSHKTTKLEFVFALKKKKITVNEQRCSFELRAAVIANKSKAIRVLSIHR